MLYSFNLVFGPQMGPTTVRLGGGVTGAARNQTASCSFCRLTWDCVLLGRIHSCNLTPKLGLAKSRDSPLD